MKKRVILATLALAVAVCVSANVSMGSKSSVKSGDQPKVEEKRALKGFECIRQMGSVDVKYKQGSTFSVTVRAPKSIIKKVETRVEGNVLVVGMKNSSKLFSFGSTSGDDVTVFVTSPDLIGVELKGSGDFECKTRIDTDNLKVSVTGSGDMEFYDIICDRIDISVLGSGDMEVKKVEARQSSISLVGSGDVKVSQQRVNHTRIELMGSGDVKVHSTNCGTVESRLQGSGDITLSGDIASHKSTKKGSGDFHTSQLTLRK